MDYTKEIRSDDKKRVKTGVKTPINRRPGWVPGGSVVFWRILAWAVLVAVGGFCCRLADAGLSGCRRGKEGGPPPGLVVLSVVARSPG